MVIDNLDIESYSGSGIYMHTSNGFIYSHSKSDDNSKRLSDMRFSDGDVVTVTLQPKTGLLSYSCKEQFFKQYTAIRSSTIEPVHFCVHMSPASDVSLENSSDQ